MWFSRHLSRHAKHELRLSLCISSFVKARTEISFNKPSKLLPSTSASFVTHILAVCWWPDECFSNLITKRVTNSCYFGRTKWQLLWRRRECPCSRGRENRRKTSGGPLRNASMPTTGSPTWYVLGLHTPHGIVQHWRAGCQALDETALKSTRVGVLSQRLKRADEQHHWESCDGLCSHILILSGKNCRSLHAKLCSFFLWKHRSCSHALKWRI